MIESIPSETIYAAFAGSLGIAAALLGNAAISETSLNGPLLWIVDGVTGLALFAGGVVSIPYLILLDMPCDGANVLFFDHEDLCCSIAWNKMLELAYHLSKCSAQRWLRVRRSRYSLKLLV